MATENITVTDEWTPLATAAQDFFLSIIPSSAVVAVEVATSDTAVAPTVAHGHRLEAFSKNNKEQLNRLIGPGYLYARCVGAGDAIVVINVWTP